MAMIITIAKNPTNPIVIISEFNLMDVPIVSNFDLISALNKLERGL